ncbi:MAG: hypothetical protein IPN69_00825 [Acidobacteria bacterium]|nr:hypothetical protein [Acidobacteriota bacterium]
MFLKRFQIPDSRIPRVPDWESRIAVQSRRVGTICGSGWLVAALPDRSIDTKRSSTIRYRRWYRLVPVPNTKNPWVFQSSRFQIPDSRIPRFQISASGKIQKRSVCRENRCSEYTLVR